jgi:cupin 2 domain-containing protein
MIIGALPADCVAYRSLGPFGAATLPAGLRRAHRLKAGCWGVLEVIAGRVRFIDEEDPARAPVDLGAGDRIVIAPGDLHHIEPEGEFTLGIRLFQQPV